MSIICCFEWNNLLVNSSRCSKHECALISVVAASVDVVCSSVCFGVFSNFTNFPFNCFLSFSISFLLQFGAELIKEKVNFIAFINRVTRICLYSYCLLIYSFFFHLCVPFFVDLLTPKVAVVCYNEMTVLIEKAEIRYKFKPKEYLA